MKLRGIWAELGTEPTKDGGAIRRAYAQRLRETNADQDAEAFARLRAARDEALRLSRTQDAPLEDELVSDAGDLEDSTLPKDSDAHEIPSDHQKYDAHYEAIIRLLRLDQDDRSRDPTFDPDLKERFAEHFEALRSDPRMAEITYFARAELWFAEALAHSAPLSHPLLRNVAAHYHWLEREGELGEAPAIAFIVNRIRSFDFVEALEEKKHRWHKAWVELRKPTNSRSTRGWGVKRRDVLDLLGNVREQHPYLEDAFDWHRIALWENEQPKYISWGAIALCLFLALKVAITVSQNSVSSVPSAAYSDLTNPEGDIKQALEHIFPNEVIDIQHLRGKNPDLIKTIENMWTNSSKFRENREQFTGDLSQFLIVSFNYNKEKMPYQILKDYDLILVEIAKSSRENSNFEECDQAFRYAQIRFLTTSELEEQERAAFYKIILATKFDENADAPADTFSIPGSVIKKLLDRTGMSETALRAALHGNGSPKDRCDVHIALVETVLKMPEKDGATLLAKL